MEAGKGLRILLAGTTVVVISGAGVTRHTTRAPRCACLPAYDYQYGSISPPVTALSTEVVSVVREPWDPGLPPRDMAQPPFPAVVRERLRYFQLDRAGLRQDHCSITQVAVTLHENGAWTLSLRGSKPVDDRTVERGVNSDSFSRRGCCSAGDPRSDQRNRRIEAEPIRRQGALLHRLSGRYRTAESGNRETGPV